MGGADVAYCIYFLVVIKSDRLERLGTTVKIISPNYCAVLYRIKAH